MNDTWFPSMDDPLLHCYKTGEYLDEMPEEDFPVLRELGFTFLQVESNHINTNETALNKWDWSEAGYLFAKIKKKGFKVTYFPHWHWPPPWYVDSSDYVRAKCLIHGETLPCMSLWDPATLPWFERCIKQLKKDQADTIDAIFVGIYGDYGEPQYPVGEPYSSQRFDRLRGLPDVHIHEDYWCGDELAQVDFKKFLENKYQTIENLNSTYSSSYSGFEQIQYPQKDSDQKTQRADFVQWYYQSMTNFSGSVAGLYRKYFPDTPLMVPMGGFKEDFRLGVDYTAVVKAMKPHNVIPRATFGGVGEFYNNHTVAAEFTGTYPLLKRISTACKLYDLSFWVEPPYPPQSDSQGVVNRIFEALSCGAAGYHEWARTIITNRQTYEKFAQYMVTDTPQVELAVFFPTSTHRQMPAPSFPEQFYQGCSDIRAIADYDVLDELLIKDDALDSYRFLIIFENEIIEQRTLQKIHQWVSRGGILIAYSDIKMTTLQGGVTLHNELFEAGPQSDTQTATKALGKGHTVFFPGNWDSRKAYYEVIRETIYNTEKLDPALKPIETYNNDWDDVFETIFPDKVVFLNLTEHDVTKTVAGRQITIPAGAIAQACLSI